MYSYSIAAYQSIVKKVAASRCMDEFLIYAIILEESSGNTWKTRFEPAYYQNNRTHYPQLYSTKLGISAETEKVQQCMSWGLMQILGVVAREFGYIDDLTKLLIPEEGITWAVQKLDKLLLKYQDTDKAISAYNHGEPVDNDPYLKSVKNYMNLIKGENIL